jgi:hypothetical protein
LIKKILLFLFLIIFIPIISFALVLFLRPALILNPKNLSFLLHKTHVLKTWRWSGASFTHEWKAWNNRNFSGYFKGLCFDYQNPSANVSTCLEAFSWDFNLIFDFTDGLRTKTLKPLFIRSSKMDVKLSSAEAQAGPPPDIKTYWKLFWLPIVPDMDFKFEHIHVKKLNIDLKLIKTPSELNAETLKFKLHATPEGFELLAPKKYPLPKKLPLAKSSIYFLNTKLSGKMEKEGIPLKLTGQLESIHFFVDSYLDLPLRGDFSSLEMRKEFLLKTKSRIELKDLKHNISKYGPKPYNVLPAPLNVMNGSIITDITTSKDTDPSSVLIDTRTKIDLKSPKQALIFSILAGVPINVKALTPGSLTLGIDFEQVLIQLPKLSKKTPPPQLLPDSRFKKDLSVDPAKKKPISYDLNVMALNDKAVHLKTNLLDEVMKFNFDVKIKNGKFKNGFLRIFPLKTVVFKRPIRLESFLMNFETGHDPILNALIKFPLPEYKISLKLEGPVSHPRHAFESVPPLPLNDIYAVLLFGRPLSDLDSDDEKAANKTNQLLAQGILSLSVLYFLAGSPVEYVGYDPNSKNATAQFGLGKKSSLRVSGGNGEGVNSTGIRRSLGKGWFLDSSIENSTTDSNTSSQTKNYGVLLERIISY